MIVLEQDFNRFHRMPADGWLPVFAGHVAISCPE
jgi:hypothetical protein